MGKWFGGFVLGVVAGVAPALADDGAFDGSYAGTKTVTFGTVPVCGTDGDANIVVKDSVLRGAFGQFPLVLPIGADGRFRGRVHAGGRGGARQALRVQGRIVNAGLNADLFQRTIHEHVCSFHWSLRKQ